MVLKYGSASSASAGFTAAFWSSAGRRAFTCADAAPESKTPAASANTPALSLPQDFTLSIGCVIAPPRARPAAGGSARPPAKQHDADRLEDDDGVQHRRLVLDVVKVVLQFLPGVV